MTAPDPVVLEAAERLGLPTQGTVPEPRPDDRRRRAFLNRLGEIGYAEVETERLREFIAGPAAELTP